MKMQQRSKKDQRLNAQLGEVIDEMARAMWNANKEYIANSKTSLPLTTSMCLALYHFKDCCDKNYGK